MRFDRLSKAQGAYILGEAIGHERTAAQNSQRGLAQLGRRSHLDSFCFWKLDRDQLSTEVRQFCLALCNG